MERLNYASLFKAERISNQGGHKTKLNTCTPDWVYARNIIYKWVFT